MKNRIPILTILMVLGYSGVALGTSSEEAAEIAGVTGCGILGSLLKHPQLSVTVAGACSYGTSATTSLVGSFIDEYFEGEDQEFANKYCITIVQADGGKINPTDKTNCSED